MTEPRTKINDSAARLAKEVLVPLPIYAFRYKTAKDDWKDERGRLRFTPEIPFDKRICKSRCQACATAEMFRNRAAGFRNSTTIVHTEPEMGI